MLLQHAAPLEPSDVDPGELVGTIKGLRAAAVRVGFAVRVQAGCGVRLPKLPSQAYRWQAWSCLYGRHEDGRAFMARQDDEGWQVTIVRPGWPRDSKATTTALRAMLRG